MKATVLMAAGFGFLLNATAQDTTSTGLDPVTVTAGFSPVQASKTGRNLVVLKGEQFYQLPVNSIDELLRYIPGVEVQARGPMGTQSDIVIRAALFSRCWSSWMAFA